MICIIIRADDEIEVRDDFDGSLQDYQDAVGGYIESVPVILPGVTAYVNEEGKINGLPLNVPATALLKYPGDMIVGDMLLIGTGEDGDDASVPPGTLKIVLEGLTSQPYESFFGEGEAPVDY